MARPYCCAYAESEGKARHACDEPRPYADLAASLRARAEATLDPGAPIDQLTHQIWDGCSTDPCASLVVDDPRTITRVVLEALADELTRTAVHTTTHLEEARHG